MKKITAKMLENLEACDYQLRKFRTNFPQGLVPNENGIARAAACGLYINWCYTNLLGFSEEQVEDISELDDCLYPYEVIEHNVRVKYETYFQDPTDVITDVALLPILFREQGWLD